MDLSNFDTDKQFKDLTTLKIGGPIKYFYQAKTKKDLVGAIKLSKRLNIPYLIIGGGSNLLVSDQGYQGLVIKANISGINQQGDSLVVQSGTKMQDLVDYTISKGFSGFYKLTGIPGTVGGAIYGKIAAYGDDISDYLNSVICFDGEKTVTLSKSECQFGYRDSIFKRNKFIILEVIFSGFPKKGQKEMEEEKLLIMAKREKLYPPSSNCPGSFFKNVKIQNAPNDILKTLSATMDPKIFNRVKDNIKNYGKIPTGALLEDLGALGDKQGQIQISKTHANTFINLGGGTAKDFYELAKKYYLKVKERFGIELEPEVQFVNLPPLNQ